MARTSCPCATSQSWLCPHRALRNHARPWPSWRSGWHPRAYRPACPPAIALGPDKSKEELGYREFNKRIGYKTVHTS